jgi:heme-degrading monooxygenase HmoA
MIVRISRADVVHDAEAAVFRTLRESAAGIARPAGLEGLVIARHVGPTGGIELVSITLWRDSDAIAAAFGDRWDRPTGMPGLDGLLTNHIVEHFEAVAAEYGELVEPGMAPGERSAGPDPGTPAR